MAQEPSPKDAPDPFDQFGFDDIELQIRMRAGAILLAIREERTPNWLDNEPSEYVMLLLTLLKGVSRTIMNYREFRKGLIEVAATALIIVNFTDQFDRQ